MAELDLGSPRIQAAMRVLGVLPKDVQPLDRAAFSGQDIRYEHLERKRQNLIHDVAGRAAKADATEASGKAGSLMNESRAARNAAFMEQVEQAEAASMAMMQKLAKKDVQKVVIQELETKVIAFKNEKRQQDGERRVKDLLKGRDDALAARQKEAAKKQEKIGEVRSRSMKAVEQRGRELTETLRVANERAENAIREKAEAEAETRVKRREMRADIFDRVAAGEASKLKARESAYAAYCEKTIAKQQMLEERLLARQSTAEMHAEKQRRTAEYVRQFWDEKQAKTEEKYWEICGRHDSAAKSRDDGLRSTIKELHTRNEKRQQAHANRYERILNEFEKEQIAKEQEQLSKSMEMSSPKSSDGEASRMQRHFSDSMLVAAERRHNHEDVVQANRLRLRRAHHFAVEQQVENLRYARQRITVMEDAKAEADRRRMEVMAKCAREKMHLQDRVDRTKNSKNPEKLYNMLEELDPDAEAVSRINELLGELGMQKIGVFKEGDEEGK